MIHHSAVHCVQDTNSHTDAHKIHTSGEKSNALNQFNSHAVSHNAMDNRQAPESNFWLLFITLIFISATDSWIVLSKSQIMEF